jgi:hypothetical protein
MKLSGQLTHSSPPMIYPTAPCAGVVNTTAIYAKYAAQFGAWIPLAQCLNQRY